jgi:hypothetical protein
LSGAKMFVSPVAWIGIAIPIVIVKHEQLYHCQIIIIVCLWLHLVVYCFAHYCGHYKKKGRTI